MKPPSPRRAIFGPLTAACVLLAVFAVGEIAARTWIAPYKKQHPPEHPDHQMQHVFQYDSRVGWLPTPGLNRRIRYPAASVQVSHNKEGFRETERDPSDRRPEWAVFGDSQTWGYNVEASDRFSNLLDERFPQKRFRNYGVSGFGTIQELLTYSYRVREHEPEGVLLLVSSNDRGNNQSERTRSGYARPQFSTQRGSIHVDEADVPNLNPAQSPTPWYRSHLVDAVRYRAKRIRGKLTPDPTATLIQEFSRRVRADGHLFAVALEEEDPEIVRLCQSLGIPVINLHRALSQAAEERPVKFPPDQGRHLTPWGHRVVADKIATELAPRLP